MSSKMDAAGCENQEGGLPNNLKNQLALAVRRIQWSYAIFWSISSKNPGVLEWFDGYYNGDIKTRKTVQAGEVNTDEQGLQRSEQLRELFGSLLVGESNPQNKRPAAALSPEDLTNAEWYYLVCMSFTFNIGQGLPGRTFKKNQTIWLSNAHQAESEVFSRSLLAKSASIKTIVCFPHVGGVVEVGITEQVAEDLNVIQLMKSSLSEMPSPVIDNTSSHVSENAGDEHMSILNFDNDMLESSIKPPIEMQIALIDSPNHDSNGHETAKLAEDSYMDDMNEEASRVQDDQTMEEDIASHMHNSVNSSDSISQNNGSKEKICLISNGEKTISFPYDIQECEQDKNCLNGQGEDIHYHSILSNLLKSSHQLILGPYFRNRNRDSCFSSWKKDGLPCIQKPQTGTPQKLLKKVLLEVSKMHKGTFVDSMKDDEKIESVCELEDNEKGENLELSEQKHKEKINDRLNILSSLVPTNGKVIKIFTGRLAEFGHGNLMKDTGYSLQVDKVSILDGTIEYLVELKRRINELESDKEVTPKTRRKPSDASERTSDNYGSNKVENGKRGHTKKRKVCEINDLKPPSKRCLLGESSSSDDISVFMVGKEIMMDLKFPSRDGVLLGIMEVMSNFHLDCNAIQSTNSEGVLSVTIRSKTKGLKLPSAAKIKEALQRVIYNW